MKLTKFDHVLSFELLDIGNPEDDPDDMEPQYVDNSQRIFSEYRTFLSIYRRAYRRHYQTKYAVNLDYWKRDTENKLWIKPKGELN